MIDIREINEIAENKKGLDMLKAAKKLDQQYKQLQREKITRDIELEK